MSAGKILQVGSPRDIYDRPSERFVADFIGETNFLSADVVGAANGRAKVRLASGAELSATFPEGFAPGAKVTVVVRPEHARLVRDGGAVSGTLDNVVYFGTDTHYHVRLGWRRPVHRAPAECAQRRKRFRGRRPCRHRRSATTPRKS